MITKRDFILHGSYFYEKYTEDKKEKVKCLNPDKLQHQLHINTARHYL